jgi:WD40 repeat protein
VRLDDGKRVRQTARRSELPPESLRLIGALTEARLLTTRSSDGAHEPLVEVTHEALFRAWPALDRWLTDQQAFLTDLERIRAAHENYAKAPDEEKSGELLYGLLLSRARDWLLKYPQRFISREMEPLRAYIAASAEVADAERARAQRTRKRQLQSAIAAAIGGIVIAAIAGWQYQEANTARLAAEKSEEVARSALSEANLAERAAQREKQAADQQRERAEQQTRLAEAQRKIAEEQRNQALVTQSRFLVDRADDMFKDGDYGTAVALVLEALPDERRGVKRPHVASAESMLYRAVMALREQKTLPLEIAPDTRFIHQAIISPDGRRVLAVASQRDARLFDGETGAEIRRVADERHEFSDAAFTADSGHLIVQSRDNGLRVIDTADGKAIRELPANLPEMAQPAEFRLLPGRAQVIAVGPDGAARLWDVVQGKQLRTLPDGAQGGAILSPDGTKLAVRTDDRVRVWNLDADTPALDIDEVKEPRAFFFPDSAHVLVTSRDGPVRVWSIAQRKVVALVFEDQHVADVTFAPDGKGVVLSSNNKIFAFDVAQLQGGDPTRPAAAIWEAHHADPSGPNDLINTLAFSPDSRFLVSASRNGIARLWRLATGGDETILRRPGAPIHAAGFSPDGKRLITVGGDKTIRIWNGTPGGTALEVTGHVARPSEAVFSPDSRRIVGRTAEGAAVWDLATGVQTARLPMPEPAISAIFLDEKRIATHSDTLHIWDTAAGTTTAIGGNRALSFVAASPDRTRVALYGALHLWNAGHASAPAPVDARLGLMSAAAFSPDGQRLAVTSTVGLHLIDAASRQEIKALAASDPTLESAAYSRDGRTLFVGSRRGTLQVLDAVTLIATDAWSVGDTAIIDLKVSPDGRRILTVTQNGTRVYDIATREEVAVLDTPSPSAITQAAFSPDGRFIAANSEYLRIWPAFPDTQALIDFARSLLPRPLTAQQRKDFFLEASATAVSAQ